LASRSGETSSTSISPASSARSVSAQESMLEELSVAACRPARPAAATWSRIRDSSGDTTSVGPWPSARRIAVAAQ
jgi:hypothetical protein